MCFAIVVLQSLFCNSGFAFAVQQQLQQEQDRLAREREEIQLQKEQIAREAQQRQQQENVSVKDTVRGILESSKFGNDFGFERPKSAGPGRVTEVRYISC